VDQRTGTGAAGTTSGGSTSIQTSEAVEPGTKVKVLNDSGTTHYIHPSDSGKSLSDLKTKTTIDRTTAASTPATPAVTKNTITIPKKQTGGHKIDITPEKKSTNVDVESNDEGTLHKITITPKNPAKPGTASAPTSPPKEGVTRIQTSHGHIDFKPAKGTEVAGKLELNHPDGTTTVHVQTRPKVTKASLTGGGSKAPPKSLSGSSSGLSAAADADGTAEFLDSIDEMEGFL